MKTVLVVDDDTAIREMASMALEKSGFAVVRAASAAEAAAALARARPDLVLCDIYMPGGDGLSVLAKVRLVADPPPVILMTARGSVETAAEAARLLGIERKTLARKLKPEYPGLPDDDEG